MKKSILYISIMLFCTTHICFSQSFAIKEERKKALYSLENRQFEKITFSKRVQNKFARHPNQEYNVLMMFERELVHILLGNYSTALKEIARNEELYFIKRNNRTYLIGLRFQEPPFQFAEDSYRDEFNLALLDYLKHNEQYLLKKIDESKVISKMEKEFLEYFIRLYIYYYEECNSRSHDRKIESAKKFVAKYPDSEYTSLIKKYSSIHISVSDWGREVFYQPYGIQIPLNGNMKEYFSNVHNLLTIGYGWNYRRFHLSGTIGLSLAKPRSEKINGEGGSIEIFDSKLVAGYALSIGNKITLSPLVGFSRFKFNFSLSNDYTTAPSDQEINYNPTAIRSLRPYIGLNIDLNRNIVFHCSKPFPEAKSFHRLQIGLSSIQAPIGAELVSSHLLFIQYSVGLQFQRSRGVQML